MSSYTEEDLTAVERAIAALGAGQSVVQVKWANGKSVTYNVTDLASLERIESKIKKALARASATSKPRRTRHYLTSKGL